MAAQTHQPEINGPRNTYFRGVYWGFGFPEDGVVRVLKALEHCCEQIHAQCNL